MWYDPGHNVMDKCEGHNVIEKLKVGVWTLKKVRHWLERNLCGTPPPQQTGNWETRNFPPSIKTKTRGGSNWEIKKPGKKIPSVSKLYTKNSKFPPDYRYFQICKFSDDFQISKFPNHFQISRFPNYFQISKFPDYCLISKFLESKVFQLLTDFQVSQLLPNFQVS